MNSRRFPVGWLLTGLIGFGLGIAFASLRNTAASIPLVAEVKRPEPSVSAQMKEAPSPAPARKTSGNMPPDVEDALRRRSAEEYIRDSNVPTQRQQREDHVRRAADHNMSLRDAEYSDLFSTLGLDRATSQQLRNHLRQIYEAKVDASRALGEVLDANLEYDRRIKQLLGENYSTYRTYEAAHPARHEYVSFQKYAAGQGLTLSPAEQSHLEKLIQNTEAYSMGTQSEWGGPYHPMPQPVGGENLKPFMLSKLEALESRSKALLAQARGAGLSEATLQTLDAYYRSEIGVLQMQLARVENPDLNRLISLQRQLERMKARPDANPRLIERLESQLKSLQQAQPPDAR